VSAILSLINEFDTNNIYLLEQGREPTAGVVLLFPVVIYQIVALSIAFIIQLFIPSYSIIIIVTLFSLYNIYFFIAVRQSHAKFKYLNNKHESLKLSSLIIPEHLKDDDLLCDNDDGIIISKQELEIK
jgi:hypothetical protein